MRIQCLKRLPERYSLASVYEANKKNAAIKTYLRKTHQTLCLDDFEDVEYFRLKKNNILTFNIKERKIYYLMG